MVYASSDDMDIRQVAIPKLIATMRNVVEFLDFGDGDTIVTAGIEQVVGQRQLGVGSDIEQAGASISRVAGACSPILQYAMADDIA